MNAMGIKASAPKWEDFVSFNDNLSDSLLELVEDIPDAPGALRVKLRTLIADRAAEVQASKNSPAASLVSGIPSFTAASTVPADQATALNKLRRSSELRTVMGSFAVALQGDGDRDSVLEIGLKSRISSIFKLITGILTSIDFGELFNPVVAQLSGVRIPKLKLGRVKPLAKCLWNLVFESQFIKYKRLKNGSFSEQFVIDFISGQWSKIDFEQRLVLDPNQVKVGNKNYLDKPHSRHRSKWFLDESLLRDLRDPLQSLMCCLGYKRKNRFGLTSAFDIVFEGFRYARDHPHCAASTANKAVNALHLAVEEAAEAFTTFIADSSPWAPFPAKQLPKGSRYADELKLSMQSADMVMEMCANCEEFGDLLQSQAKSKRKLSVADGDDSGSSAPNHVVAKKQAKKQKKSDKATHASSEASRPDPGSRAQTLSVFVDEGKGIVGIAGSKWSIAKLKDYFRGVKCWPCCVTKQQCPDVCCLTPDQPGHIRGGDDHLHRISKQQRDYVLANYKQFGIYSAKDPPLNDGIQKEAVGRIVKEQMEMARTRRPCWETSSLEEGGSSSRLHSCHSRS
jgi:hypothetical protein